MASTEDECERLIDLRTEDWVLELAQLMNTSRRSRRWKALLAGKLVSNPRNPADRKFRMIVRWIRQRLRTTPKRMWPTSHFELAVIDNLRKSRTYTRPDNDHEIGYVEIGAADLAYQRGKRKSRALAVWDAIHEFGHVLIGDPRCQESVRRYGSKCSDEREENAWSHGWSAVAKRFPDLFTKNDQRSYEARKQECMETYRRKNKRAT